MPPFFSIVTFVKNRKDKINDCLDSILQDRLNDCELVIQDGKSNDGTEKILRQYATKYKNVKLVSENDNSPSEAWFKALKRCRGQWIGLLMSDETYIKGALREVQRIIKKLNKPYPSFVYGDGNITDYNGKFLGECRGDSNFSLQRYLLNENLPHPGNSFINRQALLKAGLLTRKWIWDCCEYEVYLRLAMVAAPIYLPLKISNFAIHEKQLGANPKNLRKITEGELNLFQSFFTSKEGKKFIFLKEKAKLNIIKRSLAILHSKNNFSDDKWYFKKILNCTFCRKEIMSLLYLRTKEIIKKSNISKKPKNLKQSKNCSYSFFQKKYFLWPILSFLSSNNTSSFLYITSLRLIKPFLRIFSKV